MSEKVIFVRIYLHEKQRLLQSVMHCLEAEHPVRGVTVFRGIEGFGASGSHRSTLVDLAMDLPLVVEFFDSPNQAEAAIHALSGLVPAGHIVSWEARVHGV